jgi:hypothetical protein
VTRAERAKEMARTNQALPTRVPRVDGTSRADLSLVLPSAGSTHGGGDRVSDGYLGRLALREIRVPADQTVLQPKPDLAARRP